MTTTASPDVRTAPSPAPRPSWHLLLAGLLVVLALGGGLLLGRGMDSGAPRIDDPVDIGFAQDMKVHHAQAVEMSAILHRRTSDPDLAFLALDIMNTQQGQIGIMTGWLDVWGQTQTSAGPAMEWMGEGGHEMVGMATDEEIAALETLPVAKMEEQFLRLMIRHHLGALPMAAYAADAGTSPELTSLARGMEEGQTFEIDVMQKLLEERGLPLEPEDHGGHG